MQGQPLKHENSLIPKLTRPPSIPYFTDSPTTTTTLGSVSIKGSEGELKGVVLGGLVGNPCLFLEDVLHPSAN